MATLAISAQSVNKVLEHGLRSIFNAQLLQSIITLLLSVAIVICISLIFCGFTRHGRIVCRKDGVLEDLNVFRFCAGVSRRRLDVACIPSTIVHRSNLVRDK